MFKYSSNEIRVALPIPPFSDPFYAPVDPYGLTNTSVLVGTIGVGSTVRLVAPTRGQGCTLGALPDRRCSPGAYYDGLTTAVLCSGINWNALVSSMPSASAAGRSLKTSA